MSPRILSLRAICLLVIGITGCQTNQTKHLNSEQNDPRAIRKITDDWVKREKLHRASNDEIVHAKQFKQTFQASRAHSLDGRFSVEFVGGHIIAQGQLFSSTSEYRLIESRSGKVLVSVPSSITSELCASKEYPPTQTAWFLPDGRVLLYELWADGATSHDSIVLLYPSAESIYRIRFLQLPDFNPYSYDPEHGAVPIGVFRGSILFRPSSDRDLILKRSIHEIPPGPSPIPFGIG